MLRSVLQGGYRLCYPIVTPHILTSNQINSVSVSGVPLKQSAAGFE